MSSHVGHIDVPATTTTDPVCGMTVDPVTAPEHRGTGPDTVYFCSAGCAAAYDAGRGPHGAAAAAFTGTGTR